MCESAVWSLTQTAHAVSFSFFYLSSQHLYFPKFNFFLHSYQSWHKPDRFSSNVFESVCDSVRVSLSLMDPWAVKGLLSVCVTAPLSDYYFNWIAAGRFTVHVCELCEWVYVSLWMYDSVRVCQCSYCTWSVHKTSNCTSPKNTNSSYLSYLWDC